jgi:hypothetical protein
MNKKRKYHKKAHYRGIKRTTCAEKGKKECNYEKNEYFRIFT